MKKENKEIKEILDRYLHCSRKNRIVVSLKNCERKARRVIEGARQFGQNLPQDLPRLLKPLIETKDEFGEDLDLKRWDKLIKEVSTLDSITNGDAWVMVFTTLEREAQSQVEGEKDLIRTGNSDDYSIINTKKLELWHEENQ